MEKGRKSFFDSSRIKGPKSDGNRKEIQLRRHARRLQRD